MKSLLKYLLTVVCFGSFPLGAISQIVLPPVSVVLHYKDENRRIQSHSIQQATPLGNGDTLFQSYLSLIDSARSLSYIQWTIASSGFPLGNNLTKHTNGHWTSTTADNIILNWNFSDTFALRTPVYLDSNNYLAIELVGRGPVPHFSDSIVVWKYNFIGHGPLFSWVRKKEIWLSSLGIVQSPDFRAFPFEKKMLKLTGYDSPTTKKGLIISDSTYAPHRAGDSIRFYISHIRDTIPPNLTWSWHYELIELVSFIITTNQKQYWVAHKSIYLPRPSGSGYFLDTLILNDTISLDILPTDGRRIISFDGQHTVVLLYDSLGFNQNPNITFQRTFAHTFVSNGSQYYQYAQATGAAMDEFNQYDFRGDWGLNQYRLVGKLMNNTSTWKQLKYCDYRTVGNRRFGKIAMITSVSETQLSSRQLLSYPNPASHLLTISDEESSGQFVNVRLYDSRGRLIRQAEATFPLQIDVSELNAGLYLASIIGTNGYSKYARFVKINP